MSPLKHLICLCLISSLSSCGLFKDGKDKSHEETWNRSGIWQQVGDQPPTFIPAGIPALSDDAPGCWFTEKKGKRLFVPDESAGELAAGVLRGEAQKVTRQPPVHGVYRNL